MIFSIIDCDHGFFDPEIEESNRLSVELCLPNDEPNWIDRVQGSGVIIVQRQHIDGEIIDKISSCKVVTRYGVGLDNVDCEAMQQRGIKVINFPGFCTEEVANHAMAAILFFYRRMDVLQNFKSSLHRKWGDPYIISSVKSAENTTVGIVGAGRIGTAVIDRLLACGFKVIVYDPYRVSQSDLTEHGVECVSKLEFIFSRSDIVSLHVPLTDETRYMVNAHQLSLMRVGSTLVNTSRGEVVCTRDLIDAHNLRAAFIDVCDPEPPDESLLSEGKLYISNHCAFYSQQSLDYLKRQVIIRSWEAYNGKAE